MAAPSLDVDSLNALVASARLAGLLVQTHLDDFAEWADSDASSVIYRVLQESLTNVSRHAGVDRAELAVSGGPGELTVTVVDRGCGFDPSEPTRGFGLRESIRGRLSEAGVDCAIISAPGAGTTIRMRVRTEV